MKPMQVFEQMQKLETHEEMTTFLQSLPKKDEPWPDDPGEPASPAVTAIQEKQPMLKKNPTMASTKIPYR